MNSVQILCLTLAFVAHAQAGHVGAYAGDLYAYPKYSYSYGVKDALTGDAKSAHETRDGGVVKGSYSLLQPDGIIRTVNYVADPIHGFQAQVINSGAGVHAVGVKKAVVPAVAPVAYGHGGLHHGYGHGAVAAIAKPVAVAHAHHHAAPVLGYGHHGHAGHLGAYGGHHLGAYGGHHLGGIGAYGHHAGLVGHGHGLGHY